MRHKKWICLKSNQEFSLAITLTSSQPEHCTLHHTIARRYLTLLERVNFHHNHLLLATLQQRMFEWLFGSEDVLSSAACDWKLRSPRVAETDTVPETGTGTNRVRVACMSDAHGAYACHAAALADADLVLLAGDLLDFRQRRRAAISELDTWLGALPQPRTHILYVAGNHDTALCRAAARDTTEARAAVLQHATYLENTVVEPFPGVRVAGAPWTVRRSLRYGAQCFAERGTVFAERWRDLVRVAGGAGSDSADGRKTGSTPAHVNILVTHAPAVWPSMLQEGLAALQPDVFVFGHFHGMHGTAWGTLRPKQRPGTPKATATTGEDIPPHRMLLVGAPVVESKKVQHFVYHY